MPSVSAPDEAKGVPMVIITDPGRDLDDEMSYILLRYLRQCGLVQPLCVCCASTRSNHTCGCRYAQTPAAAGTLEPAADRARLARGTLGLLGLTPVTAVTFPMSY